jgi:hypothetical protein
LMLGELWNQERQVEAWTGAPLIDSIEKSRNRVKNRLGRIKPRGTNENATRLSRHSSLRRA